MQLDAKSALGAASILVTLGTGACHVNNTFVRMQSDLVQAKKDIEQLKREKLYFHGEAGPR